MNRRGAERIELAASWFMASILAREGALAFGLRSKMSGGGVW
jgi:hypothetical protein